MPIEDREVFFSFLSYKRWERVGRVFFKVGVAGAVHYSMGSHFPHDILFPLGYKKKNYHWKSFAA